MSASIGRAAAPSCAGRKADPWRRTQQRRLKRGAYEKGIESLEGDLEPLGTPEEQAPVRNGHRDLTHRTDCLDDPRARKLGLPIG